MEIFLRCSRPKYWCSFVKRMSVNIINSVINISKKIYMSILNGDAFRIVVLLLPNVYVG